MRYLLCSIYDSKTESYSPPFLSRTPSDAVRTIAGAMDEPNSHLAKFPEDFTLQQVGLWEDSDGSLAPLETGHRTLTTLVALRAKIANDRKEQE